ncbi:MAG: Uma2 family endonuclease [Chloroflexi bacterium]|nr:Uma2 family endonuclease [Chloroflexota bacterium]
MEIKQRLSDIDDLWRMVCEADNDKRYELIEGEIIEMSPVGEEHGFLAGKIFHYFLLNDPLQRKGIPSVETGFYTLADRSTLLSPDVAFRCISVATASPQKRWVSKMPDIAVEIKSPNDSLPQLRRKADIYLRHGTRLVWIIIPDSESVEVHRLGADGARQREVIGLAGQLSGEEVLPGFRLALSTLYA